MSTPPLIFTRAALQEMDRRAVEEFHIPILVLMENAGRTVADAVRAFRPPPKRVLIIAGPGNNGGDGLVAARHLHNEGIDVRIILITPPEKYRDAAAAQFAIIQAMKLPVEQLTTGHPELRDWLVDANPADLLIDAIFGTGLTRPVEGIAREAIEWMNSSRHPIIAVDIPSGLDCDSGEVLGAAVVARETVSFGGEKVGFKVGSGPKQVGHVHVAAIGMPVELMRQLARRA